MSNWNAEDVSTQKTDGLLMAERFTSVSRCHEFKQLFLEGRPQARSYQGVLDETVRKSDFVRVPATFHTEFEQFMGEMMLNFYGVKHLTLNEPVLIYRYGKGVGFVPHDDVVTEADAARARAIGQPVVAGDFTIVLFLSDPTEYSGGEFYFPDHGQVFKPPQGSMLSFPATEEFVHGVAAIEEGERYTVVARVWVDGTSSARP
jgi:PKHD-type hydroxylase